MGFNVKNFKSPYIEADFEKNGFNLHLWIDGDIVTPKFLQEIRGIVKKESEEKGSDLDANTENTLYMANVLARILPRWDAVDDAGNSIEPSYEFFLEMPLAMIGELFIFVMNALAPKKTTEPTSDDTILPAEN